MQKIASRRGSRPLALAAPVTRPATRGVLIVALAFAAPGCGKSNDPPPNPPGFPPGAVTPAPGSGDASARGTPALASPALSPAAAPGTPGAPLSQPNPLALPCTADAHCLTHRCNVAAGKCAWPCQTDNDCMPGNACIAPTCLPKLQ